MTEQTLKMIDTVDWSSYPQPEWNNPHDVPAALQALAHADSDAAAQEAYDRVLGALGNNHAGTYYPVVLPAVPFLGKIVKDGPVWARVGALDALIELLTSFEPEPGFETVKNPDGTTTRLTAAVQGSAAQLAPSLEHIRVSAQAHERERKLAAQLAGILAKAKPR